MNFFIHCGALAAIHNEWMWPLTPGNGTPKCEWAIRDFHEHIEGYTLIWYKCRVTDWMSPAHYHTSLLKTQLCRSDWKIYTSYFTYAEHMRILTILPSWSHRITEECTENIPPIMMSPSWEYLYSNVYFLIVISQRWAEFWVSDVQGVTHKDNKHNILSGYLKTTWPSLW